MVNITQEDADWFAEVFSKLVSNIERAFVGRTDIVKAAVTCLFAQGHLLLEDVSGSGKTTLARSLARCIYGSQARIQFTPDLSPGDITGTAVFDSKMDRFRLQPGPIFNNVIVADELNRASPRTQSALLEVMEEGRVTVRGITNVIGPPFMVIATQNTLDMDGTYALPEAQLDRFLMRLNIGRPDPDSTYLLLTEAERRDRSEVIEPILQAATLSHGVGIANSVYVDPMLIRYLMEILDATQSAPGVRTGVSIRGGLAFVRAVKTWAASKGRVHVVPQDIRDLAEPVLAHRIHLAPTALAEGRLASDVVYEIVERVPEPAG